MSRARPNREQGPESPRLPQLSGSAAYFDLVSSDYWLRYEEHSPGGYAFRVRKGRILDLLAGCSGRVLDVGCGPGVMVPDLIARGFEYWGVDAAPNMIKECHKNFSTMPSRANFSVGNAVALEFPSGSFDVVICAGVIDHVHNCERALQEMIRVLRPGGTLLVAFPNLFSPAGWWRNYVFYRTVRILRPSYYRILGRPQPPALSSLAKLHSRKSVRELIERNGGEVTRVLYHNFNPMLSPLDELFPKTAVWLTARLEGLHRLPLKWLGCGFLMAVRKRW